MRVSTDMTRKALAALACACLTLALLPAAALAQDGDEHTTYASGGIVDSGTCGDGLTWVLTDTEEAGYILAINGTGDMCDCQDYTIGTGAVVMPDGKPQEGCGKSPWDAYAKQITRVCINEGVTSIGSHAFYGHTSLQYVSIPASVTRIEKSAFEYCTSLADVYIPGTVESIDVCTFRHCTGLLNVTIANGVTNLPARFCSYCSALQSVVVGADVASVGEYAFWGCDALTGVYYAGTEEQWAATVIDIENDPLLNAAVHCGWVIEDQAPWYFWDEDWYNWDKASSSDGYEDWYNWDKASSSDGSQAVPTPQPVATTPAAQSIRLAKNKVAMRAGKKAVVKVKGARAGLCVKAPKKAKKALKVKAKGKKQVVVKAKSSAKTGTYKVKVWAKKGAGYAKSAQKTLKVRVK